MIGRLVASHGRRNAISYHAVQSAPNQWCRVCSSLAMRAGPRRPRFSAVASLRQEPGLKRRARTRVAAGVGREREREGETEGSARFPCHATQSFAAIFLEPQRSSRPKCIFFAHASTIGDVLGRAFRDCPAGDALLNGFGSDVSPVIRILRSGRAQLAN